MRKRIAAGNWKMNLSLQEGVALATAIVSDLQEEDLAKAEVVFAPPFTHLSAIIQAVQGRVAIAGQNMHQETSGAYTGEISAPMLTSVGCSHVLIGHSERRQYFGEDNALLLAKIRQALAHSLHPIYCLGETLEQREAGQTFAHLETQMREGTFALSPEEFGQLVIAYEPIWAIGTGVTASPAQAQEVHAHLRSLIEKQYGNPIADRTSILYGGSVKPANAQELFACPDIDGGLVGGASMKADAFLQIIRSF